jgi:sporulation-control protein spo0M
VIQREERLERLPLALPYRDEIDELPIVLRREPDALIVCDAPESRGVN